MRRLLESVGRLEVYDSAVQAWEAGPAPDVLLKRAEPGLWERAEKEAQQLVLGKPNRGKVLQQVRAAVGDDHWVLLGGPPCQAYSLAGRARNKGVRGYVPEDDERQNLYLEFLHVLAHGKPTAFVFENVKGLLSASLNDRRIFAKMLEDLASPYWSLEQNSRSAPPGLRYRLFSLVSGKELRATDSLLGDQFVDATDPSESVVRMEEFGVPQTRHRVMILGLRADCFPSVKSRIDVLQAAAETTVGDVLNPIKALRSGISNGGDDPARWRSTLRSAPDQRWFHSLSDFPARGADISLEIAKVVENLRVPRAGRGSNALNSELMSRCTAPATKAWKEVWSHWYRRPEFGLYPNHEARSHMASDLHRYLFAAAYARIHGSSPHLRDFPPDEFPKGLLPSHRNVEKALEGSGNFGDRFRVQVANRAGKTVTSHISKDGHYYIHFDPEQCRSLTVREAARIQTFPDDYVFLGPRTEQYRQVGNAVPPYLSAQIALVIAQLLKPAVKG